MTIPRGAEGDRIGAGDVTAPDQRHHPAVRRRKSGPALRTFFNVASKWTLSAREERSLLGWPPKSTCHKGKGGRPGTLPYDTLTRISLVLGMYKALHILYPEARFADGWMKMPNTNRLFAGRTPVEMMVGGDVDSLFAVRR